MGFINATILKYPDLQVNSYNYFQQPTTSFQDGTGRTAIQSRLLYKT